MIEVVPNALGLKKEFRDMYEDTNNFGNSSLIEGNDKSKLINVQILNLYDFILEKGIKNIDAIKIDVEGFEDQALANFIDKSKQKELPKIIIIEHSNSYKWKIDLFNLFEMKNYKAILKTRGNTIFKKIE
jgi:FkbM family methyltransferase